MSEIVHWLNSLKIATTVLFFPFRISDDVNFESSPTYHIYIFALVLYKDSLKMIMTA